MLDCDTDKIMWFVDIFKQSLVPTQYLRQMLLSESNKGWGMVFEGVQAVHLDPNQGPRQSVTSSSLHPMTGFTESLDIGLANLINAGVYVEQHFVVKSLPSSVGNHFNVSTFTDIKLKNNCKVTNSELAKMLGEFGVTTGRVRTLNYLDLPLLSYGINAFKIPETLKSKNLIAFTRLDSYNLLDVIKICVGYFNKVTNELVDYPDYHFMNNLIQYEPVFIELEGFNGYFDFAQSKNVSEFPKVAKFILDLMPLNVCTVNTSASTFINL
jgi:adenylosuccinate synthase